MNETMEDAVEEMGIQFQRYQLQYSTLVTNLKIAFKRGNYDDFELLCAELKDRYQFLLDEWYEKSLHEMQLWHEGSDAENGDTEEFDVTGVQVVKTDPVEISSPGQTEFLEIDSHVELDDPVHMINDMNHSNALYNRFSYNSETTTDSENEKSPTVLDEEYGDMVQWLGGVDEEHAETSATQGMSYSRSFDERIPRTSSVQNLISAEFGESIENVDISDISKTSNLSFTSTVMSDEVDLSRSLWENSQQIVNSICHECENTVDEIFDSLWTSMSNCIDAITGDVVPDMSYSEASEVLEASSKQAENEEDNTETFNFQECSVETDASQSDQSDQSDETENSNCHYKDSCSDVHFLDQTQWSHIDTPNSSYHSYMYQSSDTEEEYCESESEVDNCYSSVSEESYDYNNVSDCSWD